MRRGPWLLGWLLVMAAGLAYVMQRAEFKSELSQLLPQGSTAAQGLLLSELRSGVAARMLLIGLEDAEPERLAEISRGLADWMRKSGQFHFVANGAESPLQDERDLLFRYRYLLSATTTRDAFMRTQLHESLSLRLRDLSSPLAAMIRDLIARDPTGAFLSVMRTWMPGSAPLKQHGVWFSADGRRAVLMAETNAAGFDYGAQAPLQEALRAHVQSLSKDALVRLLMTGPAVFAVEIQNEIEQEVLRLSLYATVAVISFLLLTYRSLTVLILSLIPLLSGVVAGLVAVDLSFGFVHGITLAFGIILLGVVDDYPIHLFSHLDGYRPPSHIMRAIWPTMRLGIITTALGFSAMLMSGFPGLSQLGVFAIAGLMAAALATRLLLPVLTPPGFRPRRPAARLASGFDWIAKGWPLAFILVAVSGIALAWSQAAIWEQDVDNLNPVPLADKALDQSLRQDLGAPDVRHLIVLQGNDVEDVLRRSESLSTALDKLVRQGALTDYDMAAEFLPSRARQLARRAALPDNNALQDELAAALTGLPFKAGVFRPFIDAVQAARSLAPLEHAHIAGTLIERRLNSLLIQRDGTWSALVPLYGVAAPDQIAKLVSRRKKSRAHYLDLKEESNRMVNTYRDEALVYAAWGAAGIVILLTAGIRQIGTSLRVMFPIAGAIICVSALLQGLGERLSLYHLVSFMLVIGLSLDYALFFNRKHDGHEDRGRTLFGLLVCSTTTILVFGVLAGSEIPALRAIGMTAALGSLTALVFSALLARRDLESDSAGA